MKTAAAYIRVSTDDQIEYSPESQIKAIRDYAKRNDYILPDDFIFMDEGISGKTTSKRPAFLKMIAVAKTKPKPFDSILLWKFSRFARNREDSIVYKSMLRKQLGIEVISISENLGDDKLSVLIEAMIEAMDEYYSINLAEEVRRGMTEKAHRGEPLSPPPFGYRMENKNLVPNEDESAIIKQVFDWYDSGKGMLDIAKKLNAMGVRTHRGNKIENRTVEYWLNNPVYVGKIRWNPKGRTNRDYHNPDTIIADGTHLPLVDGETWKRVQQRMKEQKEKWRKWYHPHKNVSHWLVGIIRCGVCGATAVNCNGYFYCGNRSRGTCRGNGSIGVGKAEDFVINHFERVASGVIDIDAEKIKRIPTQSPDVGIFKEQLKRAQTKLTRVKEAYADGIDTIDEYRENKSKVMSEIANIREQMKIETDSSSDLQAEISKIREKIKSALPVLKSDAVGAKDKNVIAKAFVFEILKTGPDGRTFEIIYRV